MAVNGLHVTIPTTALFENSTELKQPLSLGVSTHVNATFPFGVYYSTNLSIRYLSFWVMLFLFSLVGTLGNLATLYILVRRWGCRSTFTLFKAMLAALQTLKCTVMAPLFCYVMLSQVSQNEVTSSVCKFYRTATTFFMLSTCLILTLGSLARNVMTTTPWKITSYNLAKVKAASGLSISAFIALPALLIYGTVEDETQNNSKISFLEKCIILPEYRDSLSSKAFIGLVCSLFALFSVILLVTLICLCRRFKGRPKSRLGSRNVSIGELFPSRNWSDYSFLMNEDTGTTSEKLGGMSVPNSNPEGEVSLIMSREVINSMVDFESLFNEHHASITKFAVKQDACKATGQSLENPGSISLDPAIPSDKADDVVSKDAGMEHAPSTSKNTSQRSQKGAVVSSSVDTAAKEVKEKRERKYDFFRMLSALNVIPSDPSQSDAIHLGPKNRTNLSRKHSVIIPFDSDTELSRDTRPGMALRSRLGVKPTNKSKKSQDKEGRLAFYLKLAKRSKEQDERSPLGEYFHRYKASPHPNRSNNAKDKKTSDKKDKNSSVGVQTTTNPLNLAPSTTSNHFLYTPSNHLPGISHTDSTPSIFIPGSILNFLTPNPLESPQTSLDIEHHTDHQTETIGEAVRKLSRVSVRARIMRNSSDEDHTTRTRKKSLEMTSVNSMLQAEGPSVNHTQSKGKTPTSVTGSSKPSTAHPPNSKASTVYSSKHSPPSSRFKESEVDANSDHRVRNLSVGPIQSQKSKNSTITGSAKGASSPVESPKAQPLAQQYSGESNKRSFHSFMWKPSTLKSCLNRRSRKLKKQMSRRFSWGNYQKETRGIMSVPRTLVSSLLLFLSFLCSYAPIVVLQSLEVFQPEYYNRVTDELYPLKHVIYLLFFISDFVHPFVWGFINNSFRQEVRQLISDCRWKRHLLLESQSDVSCAATPLSPSPSIMWRRGTGI